MKLSIIIVNYNVKYFLEQCLVSLIKASRNIESEIFVVDNNSVDGSDKMLYQKFPEVKLILNKINNGFSKANNQAIKEAKGDYILLINPDTVVEDDTLEKVIGFMDTHADAGGLGVKMLDGKGKFLPESKRSLPTPEVAFYKIFGLSKLFPQSRTFGKYHLGFLDKDAINEVDILSGAFMLIRKVALDKIGLLDETFFMYGEDIDLSYRLIIAGYKNYYFPETRIIHYKGESTKKSSINYVVIFYKAMIIFAKKHFTTSNVRLFSVLINIAIYLRATISIFNRLLKRMFLPLSDALLIYFGILFIKYNWEHYVKQFSGNYYPSLFIFAIIPAYIFIWLFSIYLSGGYDKPIKIRKTTQGIIIGTIVILVIYALLPETFRFSRALILLGTLWSLVSLALIRYSIHFIRYGKFPFDSDKGKRFAIIGEKAEAERVENILRKSDLQPDFIGLIAASDYDESVSNIIGNLSQIHDIIDIYKIDELIFCGKDISAAKIIDLMAELHHKELDYKIAPPESLYIIGSNSISKSEDLYVVGINSVISKSNSRNKRLLDILLCCIFILALPFEVFIVKYPHLFLKNIFIVLFGKKTWVGYNYKLIDTKKLLNKNGILNPVDTFSNKNLSIDLIEKINMLYAKDYRVINDLNIIFKAFKSLGRD